MSRTKSFTRESVLKKAIPVFLKKGYTGASIQDLEQATGVGKSSLYSEFENKDELYAACLEHFTEFKSAKSALLNKPLGWSNIEAFLDFVVENESKAETGCFLMYSVREYKVLPETLKLQSEAYLEILRGLLVKNISAENTNAKPEAIADIVMRLFAGAALFRSVRDLEKTSRTQSTEALMIMLRSL